MLVLSRRPGEKVLIGKDISVVVLGVRGNCVKLGIEAPNQVGILRGELQTSSQDCPTPAPSFVIGDSAPLCA